MKTKINENEKKQFEYFIGVISSAVNAAEAPLPYEDINWDSMLNIAKLCGLESMFADSILKLKDRISLPDELCSRLKMINSQQILIDSVLDYEIAKVIDAFEKHKVKNAPVKGYFLKNEYPRTDFRSVSDFDILFDKSQLEQVRAAFSELSYEFIQNDDSQYHFKKAPYMYIEMHNSLVHKDDDNYKYLSNQLDRSIKREGYEYSYQLSLEDHYLYLLIHSSNHFRSGGMSIRMLLDIWLYNKHHRDEFNFQYLKEKLNLYKLEKFEEQIMHITNNWFSNPTPLISFDELETYIILSCRLGRLDAAIIISSQKSIDSKDGAKGSKLSFLLHDVFPPRSSYQYRYPKAYKYPILIPFAWCHKWFSRFFIEKNVNIKRGFKNRLSYNEEDVLHLKSVFKKVGFDDLNFS